MDYEPVKSLLEEIDKVPKDENIILYFTTAGGSSVDAYNLIDYLNRMKDRIELVCNWEMSSMGFHLLNLVKCKKTIGKECFSKMHRYSNDIDCRYTDDHLSIDVFLLKQCREMDEYLFRQLRHVGFTDNEMYEIKMGRDIVLDSIRLQYALKKLEDFE